MAATDLLIDAVERVRQGVHSVLDGADEAALTWRADAQANTLAWLVWHLSRVQDDHIAGVASSDQVWTAGGWADRFGLPFAEDAIGYGHSSDEVAAVRASAELLGAYHDAVTDRTTQYLRTVSDEELSRVVDENWDPPVTLAVRLVSIVSDDLQHLGQAAFLRGLIQRR